MENERTIQPPAQMLWHCPHEHVECLDQFDLFRKYRCAFCKGVYLCDCERELAETFLPHQVHYATEQGTAKRAIVLGFASKMCAACRGEVEQPCPHAASWGLKGKVERFYWREIEKTQFELLLAHHGKPFPFPSVIHHDIAHPALAKAKRKEAIKVWQQRHKESPKYNMSERTQADFKKHTHVPEVIVEAPYVQVEQRGQKIGKWVGPGNVHLGPEDFIAGHYQAEGYEVLRGERKLISVWVGTFLGVPIGDPADPRSSLSMRNSTVGWTPRHRETGLIKFFLPEDFGTSDYFARQRELLASWLIGMKVSANLVRLYDALQEHTRLIRDYLWAADEETVQIGRRAIEVLPRNIVEGAVEWAIQDFWKRQPGWPDFLLYRNGICTFAEVKSPHDELSQEQMNWFEWAVPKSIPCQIVRLRKAKAVGSRQ